MRMLLVEDNASFAQDVERAIRPIPACELVWAASRDQALAILKAELFDLVVLDRRIPSAYGVLDDHSDHGWNVFQFIRGELPGTPVWFLTGSEDADFAVEINNDHGKIEDIHGRHAPEQMYQVFWKKRISDCIRKIRDFAANRTALDRIDIRNPISCELRPEESRILRIFGRKYDGVVIEVTSLNDGRSKSRVLKVIVKSANNSALIAAAGKLSHVPQIQTEAGRYRTDINRLTPGGFPPLTEKIDFGAGNFGGLFYGMVGDDVESLFVRVASGHATLASIPAEIHEIERPWYGSKRLENVQIAQIRRCLISDITLHECKQELQDIDTTQIESRVIAAAACVQHGDLHCANVVFDQRGRAMLIDFESTCASYAAIDPVTLELSTVFHSLHSTLPSQWPTEENMRHWASVDHFSDGCSFQGFITTCREWAIEEAGSPEEVIAVAYSYALRQLKYPDTDKALARILIRTCIQHFV